MMLYWIKDNDEGRSMTTDRTAKDERRYAVTVVKRIRHQSLIVCSCTSV